MDAREIHQIEYRWHPVKDLYPVASSMSPESTRGWDIRIRAWVCHPPAESPAQSACYQVLPPNGAVAALAWRSRAQQPSERADGSRGRPLVSRVLVGNTSLLTPEVAIALCRMGLPESAGARPGQVPPGEELPAVSADELDALVGAALPWLDREAAGAAGLSQVIAAALADPNAPLAVALPGSAIARPPGEGPQAPLLWGLWRITRPLLGTVRRGWSFSTFELPLGEGDPATLPDVVFRAGARAPADRPAPSGRSRRELTAVPGDYGLLTGTSQAWLAEWLVAEYANGGGPGVERLFAECGVEQPLQARLGAVYDLLHAKWARMVPPPVTPASAAPEERPARPEAGSFDPEGGSSQPGDHRAGPEDYPAGPEDEPAGPQALEHAPGRPARPEADWDRDQPEPAPEPWTPEPAGVAERPARPERPATAERATGADRGDGPDAAGRWVPEQEQAPRLAGRGLAGQGPLGPFPREGRPPPLPLRERTLGQAGRPPDAGDGLDEPPRAYAEDDGRPVPDLLARLVAATDDGEFKLLLQDVLTVGGEPDLGNRVEARRVMFEARWCTDPSRPDGQTLHADELARIFQVVVVPDLDRPRLAREIADWAALAPPAVVSGLLGAARGEIGRERGGAEKYHAMMVLLQPALARRWAVENGLAADWDPSLVARSRRAGRGVEAGRGFLGFRKRG